MSLARVGIHVFWVHDWTRLRDLEKEICRYVSRVMLPFCFLIPFFAFQNLVLCFETLWMIYMVWNVDTLFVFLKPFFAFRNLVLCFEILWMIHGLNRITLFVFFKPFFAFRSLVLCFEQNEWFMVWMHASWYVMQASWYT